MQGIARLVTLISVMIGTVSATERVESIGGKLSEPTHARFSSALVVERLGVMPSDSNNVRSERRADNNLCGGGSPFKPLHGKSLVTQDLRLSVFDGTEFKRSTFFAEFEKSRVAQSKISGSSPLSLGLIGLANPRATRSSSSRNSLSSLRRQHQELSGTLLPRLAGISTFTHTTAPTRIRDLRHLEVSDELNRIEFVTFIKAWAVEDTDIQSEVLRAVATTNAPRVNGLNLLYDKMHVIDNPKDYEFIAHVLSALYIQDGLLQLDSSVLQSATLIQELTIIVKQINDRLLATTDRIVTVDDLDRVLENHDGRMLQIPEHETLDPNFVTDARAGHDVNGFDIEPIEPPKLAPTYAWVHCDLERTKAHYPHESTTRRNRGKIIGKASVDCRYEDGPYQQMTFKAVSYLQQYQRYLWFFERWRQVGSYGEYEEESYMSPGHRVVFNQNWIVAVAECEPGVYKTRLALYISGNTSGIFYPYPGLYSSPARRIPCSSE